MHVLHCGHSHVWVVGGDMILQGGRIGRWDAVNYLLHIVGSLFTQGEIVYFILLQGQRLLGN